MKVLPVLLALALSARFCTYPSNPQPPPGSHQLGIAFQHWIHSGACSAANISMWVRHRGTSYGSSQQEIIDYMAWEYPWEVGPDGSFSVWAIQQALWEWSSIDTRDVWYVGNDEKRRAVADIKMGITDGNPTIVITNYGLHSKLVKGGTWTQLPNYQPSVEFISTYDPADYGGRYDTVGFWIDYVGAGEPRAQSPYIRAIQWWWQRGSGGSALAEYDYWGGTYYGDEDPPEGCPECPPIMALNRRGSILDLLRGWLSGPATRMTTSFGAVENRGDTAVRRQDRPGERRRVGSGFQATHPVRRYIFVPKPGASDRAGLVENLLAGFKQTNLHRAEGWEDLEALMLGRRLTVSSLHRVESLSGLPTYWLVTLEADGVRTAQALVSEEGWLLSVMRVQPGRSFDEPKTEAWARGVAAGLGYGLVNVRLVHMSNNVTAMSGSAEYEPFFHAGVPGGPDVFIAQDGSVYRVDPQGKGRAFWRDGERRLAKVR